MKKILYCLVLAGNIGRLSAQSVPMFEVTIKVKDAVGHLDSVVIGYDLGDIPFDTVQFHEILDNSPYDSVFDVRAEISSWEALYLYPYFGGDTYKRMITSAETAVNAPWCTLGGSSILFIQAKYQPITLYWNSVAFDPAHCRENAFFTPDKSALISDPPEAWIDGDTPIIYSCASKSDSMVCMLPRNVTWDGNVNHFQYVPFVSIREVEGIGLDTIVGIALEFVFGSYYSPCHLISGTEAPTTLPDHGFKLQPNPTGAAFEVHNERSAVVRKLRLFDSVGRLVMEQDKNDMNGEAIVCETNGLPPGIYFVDLVWSDGYEALRKLIKM